jgi:hypothetical protein
VNLQKVDLIDEDELLTVAANFAPTLALMWPNAWTRWLRRNRRYLGVSFAASHAIHAVAIAAFAVMDPAGYAAATSIASYIFGGIGYAFITAMTATSFDRTAAMLGPRAWRVLHRTSASIQDRSAASQLKLFVLDEAWRFAKDPKVKAYLTVTGEAALSSAAASDKRFKSGAPKGPLELMRWRWEALRDGLPRPPRTPTP